VKAWETLQRAEAVRKDADTLLATGDTTGAARKMAEADSVLAMVQTMDPRWTRPFIERGWLDYRRTDLIVGFDKTEYSQWLNKGLAQAEGAIKINPTDPDALELRGTLTYWRWLLNLEPGDAAAAKLVASAESDLRAAVNGNPQAAVAWAWLSHLLMGQSRSGEAKLAALKSYEADPYLSSAKQTVWRLFQSSMDLEDAVEARHWCEEGQRRFPDYYRFTECEIWLYALKGQTPAIDSAWADLAKFVEQTPPSLRPYHQMYGQMLVAMALARAGKADSARALAKRSRGDASLDPTHDLAFYEAIVRTMLGDKDEALTLLSTYYAANPQLRAGMARDQSWYFKSLRDDPRYKALLGGGGA
jgi:tetratricopeptide (TPR) repeat protein